MSPAASEHLREAQISIREAIDNGRQATTIGLAALLAVSALKDAANLPEGSVGELAVNGIEIAGNVFAGAVIVFGLGSAAISGLDALQHRYLARKAERTEGRLALLRRYTPTREEANKPRYYPERYNLDSSIT